MSKIGEIYRIDQLSPLRYFQFVAIDEEQLNSDVIAVFNYEGDLAEDQSSNLEALPAAGVDFYAHTMINVGLQDKVWSKIGKLPVIDFSAALFADVDLRDKDEFLEPFEVDHYDRWLIWRINGRQKRIKDIKKHPAEAVRSEVFAPSSIVYRIKNGKYQGPPSYGQSK